MTTIDILKKTKATWKHINNASAETKNALLLAMADSLERNRAVILVENRADMEAARGHISDVMLDRLYLDEKRLAAMAEGVRAIAALPDHTGRILSEVHRPNGMTIYKKQVPLGLVAIIYESRPNVTSDAAALTLKSGNVCMLRCGKEAYRSAHAIVKALKEGITAAGGDADIINITEDISHQSAADIMTAKGLVDLLIPRGGAGLIRTCVENATVPCIETGTGICHVYVDASADLDMALRIVVNAKTSRPSVCNAEEVLLVHSAVAEKFLPMLKTAVVDDRATLGQVPVELRLDERAAAIIPGTPAGERDFDTEFLDYIRAKHFPNPTAAHDTPRTTTPYARWGGQKVHPSAKRTHFWVSGAKEAVSHDHPTDHQSRHYAGVFPLLFLPVLLYSRGVVEKGRAPPRAFAPPHRRTDCRPQRAVRHRQPDRQRQGAGLSHRIGGRVRGGRQLHRPDRQRGGRSRRQCLLSQ